MGNTVEVAEPILVVHGHFYQPPRENPWTERVAREASAAPYHDWNERIADEAYRPNGFARVLDDHGRVVAIVDNYEHMSFDVGPTLMSWLEERRPEIYERIVEADRATRGGMAQAFGHMILPLANDRDVATQIHWGLADFRHRFGRAAVGMWLPEAAVNDRVLAALCDAGVAFTVLAPGQADTGDEPLDIRRRHRWNHPAGDGRGVDIVFYDGDLSHAAAFELPNLSSDSLVDRVLAASAAGAPLDEHATPIVTIAADGETFGHHHHFGERLLAHALTVEAPSRGVTVAAVPEALARAGDAVPVRVHESSWSCAHGVGRWREDCGCSTGGEPGWTQQWRAPLRDALDWLRDVNIEVFERRGERALQDPWRARDAYIDVLVGATTVDQFVAHHVVGDPVEALSLLEGQRHAMAMYTSCGWFFNDLAGLETVQILRYAARVIDLLVEVGEDDHEPVFVDRLSKAVSNQLHEGDGRAIWARHVVPARVKAERVVAHMALVELFERRSPQPRLGAYVVHSLEHHRDDRGTLGLTTGRVELVHRRTRRASVHAYAALHLGGLEVLGATRPADARRDPGVMTEVLDAFADGAPVTRLLRLVAEGFGPYEFSLADALPDGAEELIKAQAHDLADRFAAAYEHLYDDHRDLLEGLAAAGYPLPPVLRAPAEVALARRLATELRQLRGTFDPEAYGGAIAIAREAKASGYELDTPEARLGMERLLGDAVAAALEAEGTMRSRIVDGVVTGLHMVADLGLHPSIERAQERVYDALRGDDPDPELRRLGEALNIDVTSVTPA